MTASTRSAGNHSSGLPSGYVDIEPGSLVGRYVAGEEIGRGSYSVVYEARDPWLVRRVALKTTRAGAGGYDTALHEARLLSRVHHAHVVGIHDIVRGREIDALVLELVDGPSVSTLVRDAPLESDQVLDLVAQVADGLAALHGAGIVHRDIKPANLRLGADGALKILDLGVGCVETPEGRASCCAGVPAAGTIPYMAPERLRGRSGDCRSDLWSVGAVMYELAAGRRLVDAMTGSAQDRFVHDGRCPAPDTLISTLPRRVGDIVGRLLQSRPDDRYQTAEDLLDDLRRAFRGAHCFTTPMAACA